MQFFRHGAPRTAGEWRRAAALAAGDTAALLVFAAIGRSSHGEAAGLDAALQVAGTAAPFIAGWFLVAPALGAYGRATAGVRPMLARTAICWLAAWPVSLLLRALALQRGIPLSFALVTFVTVLFILGVWRGLFAWLAARASGESEREIDGNQPVPDPPR
ncbi:MAG: DUF3054 domain-containing protein [Chloroflexota bacterium]|nr:MAG: DUF3054 domain-containing protein [Chloroflexota bacterium]